MHCRISLYAYYLQFPLHLLITYYHGSSSLDIGDSSILSNMFSTVCLFYTGVLIDSLLNGFLCKKFKLPCADSKCVTVEDLDVLVNEEEFLMRWNYVITNCYFNLFLEILRFLYPSAIYQVLSTPTLLNLRVSKSTSILTKILVSFCILPGFWRLEGLISVP